MMMRLLALLAIVAAFFIPSVAPAQSDRFAAITTLDEANKVAENAHLAFERGESRLAQDDYLRIANSSFGGAQSWFNAGTAAYRSGDIGRAVLYYKRALKVDPSYSPARRSLEFVSPATNQEERTFLEEVLNALFDTTSPTLWVLAGQGFFLFVCFALARGIAASARDDRGHWLAVFAWCLVFSALCGGIGLANHRHRSVGNEAVVVQDKAVTRSEPREDATPQLELPAGTVLELTEDPRRGFVRFKLIDGRAGFIATDRIERI